MQLPIVPPLLPGHSVVQIDCFTISRIAIPMTRSFLSDSAFRIIFIFVRVMKKFKYLVYNLHTIKYSALQVIFKLKRYIHNVSGYNNVFNPKMTCYKSTAFLSLVRTMIRRMLSFRNMTTRRFRIWLAIAFIRPHEI